ncbi:ATP-grasp domain-containing protein [Aliikangiella coralliicola]|uniref:ATP-grasp domain-containing protein n=1 Tax=Aliikangiella coralliicola TaxID=2592383 RepID=A0A545UGI5_9GAMM|nr:ATP-grasp domain-containing protein [Aliikangiella coralliicola]TQV88580.1 ATP-grasp domain-containing protein [Aliikangiella coralliicola]
MAHLLVIESWVEGTGRLLPETLKRLGHEYTFVTRNETHYNDENTKEIHPIFLNAKCTHVLETNNVEELIHSLKELHSKEKFDGVLTICDYYIDTVAQVAKALKLPQAFSDNVSNERHKHYVREAIETAGLPNAKFFVTRSWLETKESADKLGYPLIVKPSDLASSAFVKLVHSEAELKQAFEDLETFTHNFRGQAREPLWLLEEYLSGEEVSVEAVTYQGKTTVIGITDKSVTGAPYFIEDGHMFPAALNSTLVKKIQEYVVKVLKAVGHNHGISHTEIKITREGLRVIEINPRPGGNYIAELIEHVTGINMLDVHVNLATNVEPDLSSAENKKGSAAIKFLVPPSKGKLKTLQDKNSLDSNEKILRWTMKDVCGLEVDDPIDNACYLGHVIAQDLEGLRAREIAETALAKLKLEYA